MTGPTASRPHFPALDGLRGVAILLVLFFHNFGFINYSVFGWLGVDLFFVLSGYLITSILLKTVNKPGYLRNFYARRVLRIFPLYYLVLIICFVIIPPFNILTQQLRFYIDHQWWLWLYLQNWLYSFNTPRTTSFLNHLWSLAVEEQFYLIWPFLVLLIRKPKALLWVMISILILVITLRSLVWIYKVENIVYISLYTFTRIDGICIGCMIALIRSFNADFLKNNTALIIISLAILNFVFYFINTKNSFPYFAFIGYTTFAAMFGVLVNEVVIGGTKAINFVLQLPILKFLGKISYGLYVFHWPIYLLLFPYLARSIQAFSPYTNKTICAIIVTVIAVGVATISFYGFETRFLKLKKHFT